MWTFSERKAEMGDALKKMFRNDSEVVVYTLQEFRLSPKQVGKFSFLNQFFVVRSLSATTTYHELFFYLLHAPYYNL